MNGKSDKTHLWAQARPAKTPCGYDRNRVRAIHVNSATFADNECKRCWYVMDAYEYARRNRAMN